MAKHYVRFQPPGKRLSRTSKLTSDEEIKIRKGYVFAYERPDQAFGDYGLFVGGWAEEKPCDLEAVTFTGRSPYDPGDFEGVAVKPAREVRRESAMDWLRRQARSRDSITRDAARRALERWEDSCPRKK